MISKCSAGRSQGENIELHLVWAQTSKARVNETSNKILPAIVNNVAIFSIDLQSPTILYTIFSSFIFVKSLSKELR